jgi:hypothetical protein
MKLDDLKKMSIEELREFCSDPKEFHKVKHSEAFRILVERLDATEECVIALGRLRRIKEPVVNWKTCSECGCRFGTFSDAMQAVGDGKHGFVCAKCQTPNTETQEAMKELEEGGGEKYEDENDFFKEAGLL